MLRAMDSTCLGFGACESGLVAFKKACSKSDDIDALSSRIQIFTFVRALERGAPTQPIDAGRTWLVCCLAAAAGMGQKQQRWRGCMGDGSCRSDAFFSEGKVAAMRPSGKALPVTAARASSPASQESCCVF